MVLRSNTNRLGPDECWPWTGGRDKVRGYGTIQIKGVFWRASRLSWWVNKGPIPDGLVVRHRCDNPICVNPAHLLLGTQLDNIRDRQERGRQALGERAGAAKLTEDLVVEILRLRDGGSGPRAIGRALNVSHCTVSNVLTGRTWTHVTGLSRIPRG